MQKALVKKKLIYFTKTIPKFSESEELKKKKKERKDKNQTQTSYHSLTQEKQQEKKWANK